MRVIICDDEKSTCARLEQMLTHFAFENSIDLETDVFFDGDALTEYLKRENAPDLLFLDIALPGINGIEICFWYTFLRRKPMLWSCSKTSHLIFL